MPEWNVGTVYILRDALCGGAWSNGQIVKGNRDICRILEVKVYVPLINYTEGDLREFYEKNRGVAGV